MMSYDRICNSIGPIFHKIFKIFVVINQKLCDVLVWVMSTIRYYKHTKFCQNPRADPKFLVDLTWNDPLMTENL